MYDVKKNCQDPAQNGPWLADLGGDKSFLGI